MIDYLTAYAERFQRTPVRLPGRAAGPQSRRRGWVARSPAEATSAPGRWWWPPGTTPFRPSPAGRAGDFAGEVLHSSAYRRPQPFAGSGSWSSARATRAPRSRSICENGAQVDLCMRGELHVVKRDTLGLPNPVPSILLTSCRSRWPTASPGPPCGSRWATSAAGESRPPTSARCDRSPSSARIPLVDVGTLDRIKGRHHRYARGSNVRPRRRHLHRRPATTATPPWSSRPASIRLLDLFLENAEDLPRPPGPPKNRHPGSPPRPLPNRLHPTLHRPPPRNRPRSPPRRRPNRPPPLTPLPPGIRVPSRRACLGAKLRGRRGTL